MPVLSSPFVSGLFAFEGNTELLFGLAYGGGLVGLATAVGVDDAHRNPSP